MAVITTNEDHPLIVILPGKGVWLPAEPRVAPYAYIIDIAFSRDKLYGITEAGDLIPFDLGLDEDGKPLVTIGKRVIRQPPDYDDYDWWPASDSDDDYRDSDDDDDDDDDVVGEQDEEQEVTNDDVPLDDEDKGGEEKMEAAVDVATTTHNEVVDDFDQDWPTMANDDDDGEKNFNYLNWSHIIGVDDETTSRHLVQSRGELFMVKTRTQMLTDYTMSTRQVDIFMVDVNTRKWVPMADGLGGGRALFIGPDYSKFVYAPCGDVEEDAIYLMELGEAFNTKTQNAKPTRFCEPCCYNDNGMWLFPQSWLFNSI
uniref:KIB1-4 beta-propeller domain-containing protein n=1 Tax=Aegilops tauschii TaxID=37682 RepID=R7W814_AEGTA